MLYFSSAGNQGNKDDRTSATWEGDFKASTASPPPAFIGKVVHDFGDAGQSLSVIKGNSALALIWAEHYDLSSGFASTDYDVYDMSDDLTTIFDASTNRQDGVGGDDFPVEFLGGVFGGERIVVVRVHGGTTSSAPMFNMILFGGRAFDPALATSGATRGHSAAAAAISVAATPAAASFHSQSPNGPFPQLFSAPNFSETFTSDGPRRIILDSGTGAELTPGNRTSTGGCFAQQARHHRSRRCFSGDTRIQSVLRHLRSGAACGGDCCASQIRCATYAGAGSPSSDFHRSRYRNAGRGP